MTINYLRLEALLMKILLFAPRMTPLSHIHTYIHNMTAQEWSNRESVSTASSVKTILLELTLAARRQHIYASVKSISV